MLKGAASVGGLLPICGPRKRALAQGFCPWVQVLRADTPWSWSSHGVQVQLRDDYRAHPIEEEGPLAEDLQATAPATGSDVFNGGCVDADIAG